MTHACTQWLGKLAKLNAARTAERGIAPHKPLKLLTVIDLIESGDIPDGWVKYDVLGGYYFTCALTGYRLDTETTSIVQAAHIHQHARSGNDDPRNGLALTPDAHWMFDTGLWTVIPKGDDLLVHVATRRFTESSPHSRLLAAFNCQPLHFQKHARLRPDQIHLAWHRSKYRL